MQWDRLEVQSRTDYILLIDLRFFQDVAVRYMQHHLDQYMVLGCLRVDPAKEITGYLRKVCRFTLQTLPRNFLLVPDKLFLYLKTQISDPPLRERVRRTWISDKTWASIDDRVTAHQEGDHQTARKLSQRIRTGLQMD